MTGRPNRQKEPIDDSRRPYLNVRPLQRVDGHHREYFEEWTGLGFESCRTTLGPNITRGRRKLLTQSLKAAAGKCVHRHRSFPLTLDRSIRMKPSD